MIWPLKVSRSTIAAQSRGSVKVFVQPENGSLEAIAMAVLLLPLGQHLEQQLGAAPAKFQVAELVWEITDRRAVASDRFRQPLVATD